MPIYMGIFEKPHVLDRKFRGGVKAKGYEGWIQLQSAQLGTNRNITTSTGRGTNREASAPAIQEVVITKLQDSVSTALYRETLGGEGEAHRDRLREGGRNELHDDRDAEHDDLVL
jgi:type VI protein secretion system component Hcp